MSVFPSPNDPAKLEAALRELRSLVDAADNAPSLEAQRVSLRKIEPLIWEAIRLSFHAEARAAQLAHEADVAERAARLRHQYAEKVA